MLNQFVLIGRFVSSMSLSEEKELWIINVEDYNAGFNNKVNYTITIRINFKNDNFKQIKVNDLLGVKGKIIEEDNQTFLLAEKITFLKSGVNE